MYANGEASYSNSVSHVPVLLSTKLKIVKTCVNIVISYLTCNCVKHVNFYVKVTNFKSFIQEPH